MTTLQPRSPFKAGNAIGMNTQNITFNLPDKAAELLEAVSKPNRSHFLRLAVARELDRINRWTGMAFRSACQQLKDDIKSIFSPGSAEEKAQVWIDQANKFVAQKTEAIPNAEAFIDDLLKLNPDGTFEPTKFEKAEKENSNQAAFDHEL